jgi:hypothetical protein
LAGRNTCLNPSLKILTIEKFSGEHILKTTDFEIKTFFHTGVFMDNKYISPDNDGAARAFLQTAVYTEALWKNEFNRDEEKVRTYTLPEIKSQTVEEWENVERPLLVQQFKDILYGEMPPAPDKLELELLSEKDNALDGLAVRKEIRLHCAMNNGKTFDFDMLLYVPKNAKVPPPVFVGLNFSGNQANTPEDDVRQTRAMNYSYLEPFITPCTARCARLDTWNYVEAMKRGYAVATACYSEICPDHLNGLKASVFTLFYGFRLNSISRIGIIEENFSTRSVF